MKDKTNSNELDFNVDFSSESGGGQVGSIEDFLEDEGVTPDNVGDGDGNNEGGNNIADPENGDEVDNGDEGDGEEDGLDLEILGGLPENNEDGGGDEGNEDGDGEKQDGEGGLSNQDTLNYKSILSNLMKSKILDEIEAFENEEGEIIPFDEVDIDEEMFSNIVKQKIEEVENKAKEGRVSTEGVSDFTQKLIEIEKKGGNVAQALESYQTYKSPLENLDLTKVSDQQAVLAMVYEAKGLKDEEIVKIIKGFEDDGVLEEKALESERLLNSAYEKQLEAINKEAEDREAARQKAIKDYRKDLGEELKQFTLADSYKRKILDLATKPDNNGRFELDSIYSEVRKDPAKAAELVMFLTDKEEYIKQLTEKDKRDDKLNTMKTMKFVKKNKSSDIKIKNQEKGTNDKNFIDLNDLK